MRRSHTLLHIVPAMTVRIPTVMIRQPMMVLIREKLVDGEYERRNLKGGMTRSTVRKVEERDEERLASHQVVCTTAGRLCRGAKAE